MLFQASKVQNEIYLKKHSNFEPYPPPLQYKGIQRGHRLVLCLLVVHPCGESGLAESREIDLKQTIHLPAEERREIRPHQLSPSHCVTNFRGRIYMHFRSFHLMMADGQTLFACSLTLIDYQSFKIFSLFLGFQT